MFLHLGGDNIIDKHEIIAILDLDSASNAQATRDFLKTVNKNGSVVSICEEGKERSFVITKKCTYLSPISSYTLLKRANSTELNIEND